LQVSELGIYALVSFGSWAFACVKIWFGLSSDPFLLHDNGPDADERVVIFAKEHHIQKLADSDVWCMDDNFAMAPSIFMQLYVIQGHQVDHRKV
jgi:hypothetical protein